MKFATDPKPHASAYNAVNRPSQRTTVLAASAPIRFTPSLNLRVSSYVPALTLTVSPALAASSAAWIVAYWPGTPSVRPVPAAGGVPRPEGEAAGFAGLLRAAATSGDPGRSAGAVVAAGVAICCSCRRRSAATRSRSAFSRQPTTTTASAIPPRTSTASVTAPKTAQARPCEGRGATGW